MEPVNRVDLQAFFIVMVNLFSPHPALIFSSP